MRSMVSEAKVTRRFNTGDFTFEEYTLGAIVDESESGADVLTELKKQINEAFVGEVSKPKQDDKKSTKKEEKKNAKPSKASIVDDKNSDDEDPASEDAGNDGESDQDDEAADGEDSDNTDDSSDGSEDSAAEDEASDEEEVTKPAKKGGSKSDSKDADKKGGKKYKTKSQNYNRGIEQHKEIFSGVLRSVSPSWKQSDVLKQKAKKASETLDGTEFLDENGEVLPSFKAEVKKLMTVKAK